MKTPTMTSPVICPYCNRKAILVDSVEVYGTSYGMIWLCRPCHAYVGTYRNSSPLGTLANKELRKYRQQAHNLFDPTWRGTRKKSRNEAYEWLAKKLGIDKEKCHIGMFNIAQCKRVIQVMQRVKGNTDG